MGTRSHIYIETEPGMFLGTYCQFDGYPSHMFPQLEQRTHTEVYGIIVKGQTRGGLQSIHPPKGPEYQAHTLGCFLFNPMDYMENSPVTYVYIKRLDGSVLCRESRKGVSGEPMPWFNEMPEEE